MKDRKLVVGVACDGVLANFTAAATALLLERFNVQLPRVLQWDLNHYIPEEHRDALWEACGSARFHEDLMHPYAEAQLFWPELNRIADVYVVTSDMKSAPLWVHFRDRWLEKHFAVKSSHILHTHAKHRFKGDLFIDDKPSHVEGWVKEHPEGIGILWAQPYNAEWEGEAFRTNSWPAVSRILKVMECAKSPSLTR